MTGRSRPSVSIVVPALNEEKTLARAVEWTLEILKSVADDFEILVVDDGSTDATGRIADELGDPSFSPYRIRRGAERGISSRYERCHQLDPGRLRVLAKRATAVHGRDGAHRQRHRDQHGA